MRAYPIIVLHQGNHDYLRICLEQAKFTNPNSRIILLGDKKAQSVAPDYVEFYDTKDYFNTAKEFSKVYKHHSTNYYEFELFCIQRWFIVNEFIQKNNIEYFLHLDSDVLLYADFEKVYHTGILTFKRGWDFYCYNKRRKFPVKTAYRSRIKCKERRIRLSIQRAVS